MSHNFVARNECPACGSRASRTLYRCAFTAPPILPFLKASYPGGSDFETLLAGGEYRVDECIACTLVFQQSVGNAELLDAVYDNWLNKTYSPEDDAEYRWMIEFPARSRDGHEVIAAARFLRKPTDAMAVLDFGMGWAAWGRIALGLGCSVFGFDLSKERCEYAKAHGISVVTWDEISRLSVDFINAEQVFEHTTSPFEDLRQVAAALRPGGIIKISVPTQPAIRELLRDPNFDAPRDGPTSLNAVHPIEHVNCYNAHSLTVMAARAGLRPVRIPIDAYYAFFARPNSIDARSMTRVAKAILRPLYHRLSRRNLYMWFQKPEV